jgi:hypothetical protein
MSENKKMVRKSVALAFGVVGTILVALTAYFAVASISAQNSYNNLQNQNKQLQVWLAGNESLLKQTQIWLEENNSDALYLNQSILLLNQTLTQSPNSFSDFASENNYAGYVAVNVTSTSNTTYVEAIFSTEGINYDNKIIVGAHGLAVFPFVPYPPNQLNNFGGPPKNDLDIRIGNTNTISNATETVTITYYF